MVEIINSKKNIIILFILMIILLFFIYKGFFADCNHYLEEYKNYLIYANSSDYYFKKIEKEKAMDGNKYKGFKKAKKLLSEIKKYNNKNEDIAKNLQNNITSNKNNSKTELKELIKNFVSINYKIDEISDIISKLS